jgi:hypothetical protein
MAEVLEEAEAVHGLAVALVILVESVVVLLVVEERVG